MKGQPKALEPIWLDRQREKLQAARERLREAIEREEVELKVTGTSRPRESADLAEEEREDLEVLETLPALLERYGAIKQALERIDAGTYGKCEDCGKAIPRARLEALPQALLCVSCQKKRGKQAVGQP
jgi:RNA polymerase-binding transcription factor DksA